MAILFFFHVFTTLCCLISGFFTYTYILKDPLQDNNNRYKPLIVYLLTGLIVLTILCQLSVLFFPVNVTVKIALLSLLLVSALSAKKMFTDFLRHVTGTFKKMPRLIIAGAGLTWLLILWLNAGETMMDDTESYHIQMVKWIQEHGTVKGIANLHLRFGFNSSWFSSIALFSWPAKHLNYFTTLNGVLSAWFAGFLFSEVAKINVKKEANDLRTHSITCLLILIASMMVWPMIRGNASTCNYDFITTVITLVLFTKTITCSLYAREFRFHGEWVIWPAYLFTVRIINYPLLLLSVFGLWMVWKNGSKRLTLYYLYALILMIVPFLLRNIALSGYAFFPSTAFDWFAVDWKADKEKTLQLLHFIKYFNRVNTGIQNIDLTEKLAFPGWIYAWFKNLAVYDKVLLMASSLGFLCAGFYIRFLFRPLYRYTAVFMLAVFVQLVSWFFIAPDPRFVYGCLLCGMALLILPFENAVKLRKRIQVYNISILLVIAAISGFTGWKFIHSGPHHNWLKPATLPQPQVKVVAVDHIRLNIPRKVLNNWNPRCFATELPCVYEVDPRLKSRGSSIAEGFTIRK